MEEIERTIIADLERELIRGVVVLKWMDELAQVDDDERGYGRETVKDLRVVNKPFV